MSTAGIICQIPGNSDIAGVGVRATVYIQASLTMANFAYMSYIYADSTKADMRSVQFEKSGVFHTQGRRSSHITGLRPSIRVPRDSTDSGTIPFHSGIHCHSQRYTQGQVLCRVDGLPRRDRAQYHNWAGFLLLFMRGWLRLCSKQEGESLLKVLIFPASWTSSLRCAAILLPCQDWGYSSGSTQRLFMVMVANLWNSHVDLRTAKMSDKLLRMFSIMFYVTTLIPYVGLWFQLFVFALCLAYATLIAMAVLVFAQLLLERLVSICRAFLRGLRRLFICCRPFTLEEAAAERTVSSSICKIPSRHRRRASGSF